jgi:hypothetical protein
MWHHGKEKEKTENRMDCRSCSVVRKKKGEQA